MARVPQAAALAAAAMILVGATSPASAARRGVSPQASAAAAAALPPFDSRSGARSSAARGGGSATAAGRARADLRSRLGDQAVLDADPLTGTLRVLQRLDGALSSPASGDPADVGLRYARANAAALGLSGPDFGTLHLAFRSTTPGSGVTRLRFAQELDGIPYFDNDLRVNLDRAGRVLSVLGAPVHAPAVDSTTPSMSASAAMDALQRNVGVERAVAVVTAASGGRRETTFSTGDFARLVLFHGNRGTRLAWHLTYAATSTADYDAVVDAADGAILYRQNLTKFSDISAFDAWPGAPNSGGVQHTQTIPQSWLGDNATALDGPNAHAWTDINDDDSAGAGEEIPKSSAAGWEWAFHDVPTGGGCDPAFALCGWDSSIRNSWVPNREQSGTQVFYFVNTFHDHLASAPIAFASPDNFEGPDPVLAQALDGAATGTAGGPDGSHIDNANMSTPPDPQSPTMQMYLFVNEEPNGPPFRDVDGDDSAAVVYHEYTHGLSNRLVVNADGSGALNSAHAGAMGEAWSDWYAMDFLARQGYVSDDPGHGGDVYIGDYTDAVQGVIRAQAMDCKVGLADAACPGGSSTGAGGLTFADFGKIYGSPEVHGDGEIWGETLWDLRQALVADLGSESAGSDAAEALVTDGMRLSPPEPSFLDMRNAILAADTAAGGAHRDLIWGVFQNRGMGFYASVVDSSDVAVVEDVSPPPPANGAKGRIAGVITSADTGLPVAGVTVGIGGLDTAGIAGGLAGLTDATGAYAIPGVPVGTYPKLTVHPAAGFDQVVIPNLAVTGGGTTTGTATVRRDWSSLKGGGSVLSTNDDDFADIGCGASQLIDQGFGAGWSANNPDASANDNHSDPPQVVLELPTTIDVTAFGLDPSNNCTDDPSAMTKDYRVETSTDGVSFVTALEGAFTAADHGRLNVLAPTAGAADVRFVRLTLLSPMSTAPDQNGSVSGQFYIDFMELEVFGGTKNALPAGALTVSKASAAPNETLTFDASSFKDADSLITAYDWDFDGNGTVDQSTTAPSARTSFASPGTYTAKVAVHDFRTGVGTATAVVTVAAPAAATPPAATVPGAKPQAYVLPIPGPSISISRTSTKARARYQVTCATGCRVVGKLTITRKLARKLRLKSRTIGTLTTTITAAGKRTLQLRITAKVRRALRRAHAKRVKASLLVTARDTQAPPLSATARRTVTIRLR